MHGFWRGRFSYIGRSLPCIRLSSHLYLSKMYHLPKWKGLWRVSTRGFTLKQHFFFPLVVTREEAGGSGGASCVLSALKPVPAPPGRKAKRCFWWPRCNTQWKLSWWADNPVLKLAPRFSQLAREAHTRRQQPRGGGQAPLPTLARAQSILATPVLLDLHSPTPQVSPVLSQPLVR